jgi:hypothetical protein
MFTECDISGYIRTRTGGEAEPPPLPDVTVRSWKFNKLSLLPQQMIAGEIGFLQREAPQAEGWNSRSGR